MSDLKEKDPEKEGSGQEEIESPTDGPPPDWMKTATSSAGSSFSDDEAPDWLKNIRAGETGETEAEASEGESAGAAEDDGLSDLERLLAEEGIDLTGVEDERPEDAEGMSVKDWMIATSDDEIIRKRIGAEPGEEPAPVPAPEPEPAESAPPPEPATVPEPMQTAGDQDVVEEELPDWLREISDEVETSPPLDTAPEPVTAVEEVEDDKMVVGEDLPDWLQEVSAEVNAESPSAAPKPEPAGAVEEAELDQAAEMFEGDDLPDWLQGISDEPAAAEPEAEAPISEEFAEEEMADWLQEVSDDDAQEVEEIVTSTSDDDKLVVADELPSWLREVEEKPEEVPSIEEMPPTFDQVAPEPVAGEAGEDESSVEEEVPDWLQEAADSTVEEEDFGPQFEAAPPSYSVTDSTDTIDEENLPDWLRDVQEDESEAVSETVLAEVGIDEDIVEAAEEEALPDWLKEVQEEDVPPEPAPEPDLPVEPTPTPPATEDVLAEELPGWLQEAADESVEASFEAEAVAESTDLEEMEGGELPDWLQEVQVAEESPIEPFEPSEPSPDDLFTSEPVEEPDVMQEELPDWLQEVKEEGLEVPVVEELDLAVAAAPELAPEYAVEESLIEEEELPDWLQVEEEAEPEEPVAVPPEPELEPEPEPAVSEVELPSPELSPEPEPEVIEEAPLAPTPEEVAPVVEAAPAAKSISDLPDWLKKLREGDVVEEEVAPVEPLPKPAVVEPFGEVVSEPETVVKPEAEAEVSVPEEASKRLEMARSARDGGNVAEAVQFYESLVSSGLHLDLVIEDMQQTVKSYPSNASLYQVMGDAMMKDGRLQSALDAYRQALTNL